MKLDSFLKLLEIGDYVTKIFYFFYLAFLRFASVTVNLGPTFLSGALAANAGAVMDEPSCPLVQVIASEQPVK